MGLPFEIASGTVLGRLHLKSGKNNQDAFVVKQTTDKIVAVVSDGCSGCVHSEVGAYLGARVCLRAFELLVSEVPPMKLKAALEIAEPFIRERLGTFAVDSRYELCNTEKDIKASILDSLLFSLVIVTVSEHWTYLFAIGDGVIGVNGEITNLGPFPNNAPPYIGYALSESRGGFKSEDLKFRVIKMIPTKEVESLLIGSDGVLDLMAAEQTPLPGKTDFVGPIGQFWQQSIFFDNQDEIRRKLACCNKEVIRLNKAQNGIEKFPGILPDDTTMVVIRRKK